MVEGRGGSDVHGVLGEILDVGGVEWLHEGESAGVLGGHLALCGIRVHEAVGVVGGREVGVGAVAGLAVALVDYSPDDGVDGHRDHEDDPGQ
jgi:hypothetical protein